MNFGHYWLDLMSIVMLISCDPIGYAPWPEKASAEDIEGVNVNYLGRAMSVSNRTGSEISLLKDR